MSQKRKTYVSAFVPGNEEEPSHSVQIIQSLDFDAAISFYHLNEKLFAKSANSVRLHDELSQTLNLLISRKHPVIKKFGATVLWMRIRYWKLSRN